MRRDRSAPLPAGLTIDLPIAEFTLHSDRDVAWAAQRARLLGSLANVSQKQRSALGKAVTQIAHNAVVHGGGGTITFALVRLDGRPAIEVAVRDQGRGIDDVPGCLARAEERQSGLHLARRLTQHFALVSRGHGVTAELRLEVPAAEGLERLAATEWGTALAIRTSQGALNQSQRRISELAGRLEHLQQRGASIEEQLQQVKSLNETLELLALVASKTVNAVVIMDASGSIEWVNEGFERMTGFAAAEVTGQRLAELLKVAEGESEVGEGLQQAIDSGHGVSLDVKHIRKDGQAYWASLSLTPAFDEAGRAARWICIANDVSGRREAQEELRKARDLAEAASRTKSMFLANISHEIRTPMNAVIGMTQLALDTDLSAEQREYLTAVEASAASLLRLLNDLLDLSKIEAGKIEMDPAPFLLSRLLSQTLGPLVLQARRKGVELTWHVAEEVPAVLVGDETRMQQLLVNLVSNAVKFTAAGEVRVDVESQWQADGNIGLVCSVRDTGIGISADKLESIFEAFTQADASTARHYGGTGLGLAICAHLIELMGGRIWVESRVGEGSCFRFSIRLEIGRPEAVELLGGETAAPSRRLRVLVADDNPANRLLAERILQNAGIKSSRSPTGVRRWRQPAGSDSTSPCWMCRCPSWTGFRPRPSCASASATRASDCRWWPSRPPP